MSAAGSLLDPAVLFFVVGLAAGLARSNLAIPPPVSRFLSLYLLMALGLKGGFALAKTGLTEEVVTGLVCALLLAGTVPLIAFATLRRVVSGFDAAALAATYGSVSAVTFITAVQMLDARAVSYGGHMAAAMALMESPAIVIGVLLANRLRNATRAPPDAAAMRPVPSVPTGPSVAHILRESLTDGAQVLLLAAMLVGIVSGGAGEAAMKPFSTDLFKGMLAFFLLDMGLQCARNIGELKGRPGVLLIYAVAAPLLHAALALALAAATGMSPGDGALLMALTASASYIAVPAVIRHAIPEASPSLYFGMSLGITFPFNILVGLPLYLHFAERLLS